MDAQGFVAVHRDPEELPAPAVFQPVAMIVRHEQEQRFAFAHPIAPVLVAQVSSTRDRVLQHGERGVAALPPVPVIGGIGADFITGAGRHRVQALAPPRQRNRSHDRAIIDQILQHKITHESTIPLWRGRRLYT
ncbi:hypothetical protein D9M70_486670 [compost metagenome]